MEGLILGIAQARANKTAIPDMPKERDRHSAFAPCRKYLNEIGFTDAAEDEFLKAFYSFASVTGSHPRITPAEVGKLALVAQSRE